MKKIIKILCVTFAVLMALSACTSSTNSAKNNRDKNMDLTETAGMAELCNAMKAATTFPESVYTDSDSENSATAFKELSDMDYGKVDSWFDCVAKDEKSSVNEIAIIVVYESADADEALKALQNHVDKRISDCKKGSAELKEALENAVTYIDGRYAVLIVSEDAEAIRTAFDNFMINGN